MRDHPKEREGISDGGPGQPWGVLAVDPEKKIFREVRSLAESMDGWTFLGGVPDWTEAVVAAREGAPVAIFVNLDANPDEAMAVAAEISDSSPQSVLLGVSKGGTEDHLIRGVRSGFRDFLAFPFDSEEAIAALSRIERVKDARRLGQVITLFSPKGGSGLTTLTVNLGILLAREQNKKVSLIDMDLEFGDISFFRNLSPSTTLAELAERDDLPIRTALHEALIPHASGVEVLAAPKEIQQAEKVTAENIGPIIREMREMFDFVLINTGNNLSPANLKTLDLSGTILLVTLPHLAAVAHAKRTLNVFTTLGYEKKIRLIVNRYNPAEDDMSPEEIGKTVGIPVLKSLPSDYRAVIHAINRGLSLWECAPRSPVTRAMFNLAETLCGGETAPSRRKPGKKGLFRLCRQTPEKRFSRMSRKGDLTPSPGEAPCELPS